MAIDDIHYIHNATNGDKKGLGLAKSSKNVDRNLNHSYLESKNHYTF